MIRQRDFDAIVGAFHAAALDDERWPEAARLTDESCRAVGSHIAVALDGEFVVDEESAFGRTYYRGEVYEETEQDYLRNYAEFDERAPKMRALPYGRLVTNRELLSTREFRTSSFINEMLPKYECGEQLLARIDGGPGLDILWALSKTTKQGDWETEQVRLVHALVPHLAHAVAVRQELLAARLLGGTLEDLLGGSTAGVAYLDRGGSIVGSNASADRTLSLRNGLVDRCGKLRARHADDDVRLGRLLNRALRPDAAGTPSGGSTTVRRRPCEPALVVHVQPVAGFRTMAGAPSVAAVVLIVDPWMKFRVDPRRTAEVLDLTPAEGRVVASLVEGMSVRQIARASGRSENTVRWQLKQAMAKTGCSRQAELVRLALLALKPAAIS